MNVGVIVDLDEVSCFALEIQLSADSALCFKYYWIRIYFCASYSASKFQEIFNQ